MTPSFERLRPTCQNHTATQWLERQQAKRLPVDYFVVTFTLAAGLRPLAAAQPKAVYAALFAAASSTLKGFGARQLKAQMGQCAVLHTHSRRLDLHPHVHIVVPGGGIDVRRRQFKSSRDVICSTPSPWRGCFERGCWPHCIGQACRLRSACHPSGWPIVATWVAASRRCNNCRAISTAA